MARVGPQRHKKKRNGIVKSLIDTQHFMLSIYHSVYVVDARQY